MVMEVVVGQVLGAIKSGDVATVLKELNSGQVDVLTKYLYRGMSSPSQFPAGVLLVWYRLLTRHEKIVEMCGYGSIIRCMTDRKTV
jgi:actin related protein 2/3 complex, subunit 5